MSVAKIIQPKLHHMSGGLFGNWLPTNIVSVGDFGAIRNSQFERHGAFSEYGAVIDLEPSPSVKNNLDYKDRLDISVSVTADASAGPGSGAKIHLKMAARGSFIYHLSNATLMRPANTRNFNEEIAKALIAGDLDFPESGVLITEVYHAPKATIVVSDSKEASLDLQTDFKPTGDAFLAGAKGGVKSTASRGSVFQFVAHNDIPALLRIVRPKISPPSGPGAGAAAPGGARPTLQWVRNVFREKQLHISDLIITSRTGAVPVMNIQLGRNGPEFLLSLENLSVEEMVESTQEEEPVQLDDLEVEEQEFGRRRGSASAA